MFNNRCSKGVEMRGAKTLNFALFTLRDQLVAQQKYLLRVEESCSEK